MENNELRELINQVANHVYESPLRAMLTANKDGEDYKHFSNGWLLGLMELRDRLDEQDVDYHMPTKDEARRALNA